MFSRLEPSVFSPDRLRQSETVQSVYRIHYGCHFGARDFTLVSLVPLFFNTSAGLFVNPFY